MSQAEPLTFEAFQQLLAVLLAVDVARLSEDAYFVTDLGVDSLGMLRILLRLEDLGLAFSLENAFQIQTVGDAYRVYRQSVGKA